jgi:formylglycine-generating enzyme required for sulfatase activity
MGKLRDRTGLSTFDLPTESQWEYACRAGTTTALNSGQNLTDPWGNDPQMNVVGRFWYNGGSGYSQGGDTSVGTAKAGSYQANAWGLYDMHGNVWEWCLDWYDIYPGTVSDPVGAASGSYRVLRGGDWSYRARHCRSAFRGFYDPDGRDDGDDYGGFRPARTLP